MKLCFTVPNSNAKQLFLGLARMPCMLQSRLSKHVPHWCGEELVFLLQRCFSSQGYTIIALLTSQGMSTYNTFNFESWRFCRLQEDDSVVHRKTLKCCDDLKDEHQNLKAVNELCFEEMVRSGIDVTVWTSMRALGLGRNWYSITNFWDSNVRANG